MGGIKRSTREEQLSSSIRLTVTFGTLQTRKQEQLSIIMEQNANLKGTDTPNAEFSSESVLGSNNQDLLGKSSNSSHSTRLESFPCQTAKSTNSSKM